MKGIKMSSYKCFNKTTILHANKEAKKNNYNRQLEPKFVDSLPEDVWFPIFFTMMHEHAAGVKVDMHVRCWVQFDEHGTKGWIDIPMKIYNTLATFNVPDEDKANV